MAKQTKATLEAEKLDAVADRGYFSGAEILACEQAGITVTLPNDDLERQGEGASQADFRYVAEEDVYICPPVKGRLPLHKRGKWVGPAPLLDQCLPELRHQT